MARATLFTFLLTALLAVASESLATGSSASGIWNSTLFVNKTVSGAADGNIFVTSLDYRFGGFNAEITAVDAATGLPWWTTSTFGELEIPLTFYSFSTAPGAVFILFSNVRPAKLVAYNSHNGTVLWTVQDSAISQLTTLVASPDGSVLSAVYGRRDGPDAAYGMSIDRVTGTVLAKRLEVVSPVYALVCGSSRVPCLATTTYLSYYNGTVIWGVALFDSRKGTVLASRNITRAYGGLALWGSGDVLLVSDNTDGTHRLDTTRLSVLWSRNEILNSLVTAFSAEFTNATTGKSSRAMIIPHYYDATVLDLDTGALLPYGNPSYTCPTGAPAPSTSAYAWNLVLSPFISGYVASVVTCTYGGSNPRSVTIYALYFVSNMTAPVWWRYTSASSYNAFITVGSNSYLLVNECDSTSVSTADIYDTSLNPLRQYSWASSLCAGYYAQPLVGWTTAGMAILQQNVASPPSSFYLARVQ